MRREDAASHLFHVFLKRNPDDKERTEAAQYGVRHDSYIWHDVVDEIKRPILLMYTSCHADQFLSYLRQYRQEILSDYHVVILFTHRLQLYSGLFSFELIHAIFRMADLVITNPMNPKFGELSTIHLLPLCKPQCKIATFVPPSVAAFWPIVQVFGEEPIAKAIKDGLTADQTVERFLNGQLDCMFDYRYQAQMERLKLREKDCDVAISGFIDKNLKTHKMFFTSNHPTFHLATFIIEGLLNKLGFPVQFPESWPLLAPVNGANFSDHYPETDYEWGHYKLEYPKRFEKELGGARRFYPEIIRKSFAAMKEPEKVLANPVTPPELEV